MKALTLHAPYARLIALGVKRYETRPASFNYKHRGTLAIHESQQALDLLLVARILDEAPDGALKLLEVSEERPGHILAICRLVEVYEMASAADVDPKTPETISQYRLIENQTRLERAVGNWWPGRKAIELSEVRPLIEPVKVRGYQGLWTVPADVEQKIWAQLGSPAA